MAERLQKGQNTIQNIEFHIDFPHTLKIQLKSYPALFQTQEHIILANGSFVTKENQASSDLPLIHIMSKDKDPLLFETSLKPEDLEQIQLLLSEIKKKIQNFEIRSILFFLSERECIVSDATGTLYIFDLTNTPARQVEQLSIFQKE